MRFKITLEVLSEKSGTVLPICYQHALNLAVEKLLLSDSERLSQRLSGNGVSAHDFFEFRSYAISNLYIPRIYVKGDRLQINVPRIQFWLSFYHESGTREFLHSALLGQEIVIGDHLSSVEFRVTSVDDISPVRYNEVMEYQTLSPIVVLGVRPNQSIEYLFPRNIVFSDFMVDDLIQRWEHLHQRPYSGGRRYQFQLLKPERRKVVTIDAPELDNHRVVGYMLRFRLVMDPQLQEIAYVCGIGDYINYGFGFIELLEKSAD